MFAVYRLMAALAAPLALAWLRWRVAGPAPLRRKWRERLGTLPDVEPGAIWIHAASVGEVNAAQPLIGALAERRENHRLIISTFTITGRERAAELFGETHDIVFAPVDTFITVKRWLRRVRPALAIMVETELWPELFHQCDRAGIPMVLVNARLAPDAMRHYRRFRRLFARTLAYVDLAICQSRDDARRFGELGLDEERIEVAGNLKFDMTVPDDIGRRSRKLRELWGERPVWVAGSTREGEERIVLDAHHRMLDSRPEALLVLAPRHPERSDAIGALIERRGLKYQGIDESVDSDTAVVLVDRLGWLTTCYAAAPAAFVGGSLVDIGGHNLLEPAGFGKVVLAGPHLHQQAEMARTLDQAGALVKVRDAAELAAAVREVWANPESALERGRRAMGVVEAGRGSVRRSLAWIMRVLDDQSSS
ncbi:MAG: 3-deoxy-D-manno-octulosonic acid transferase [Wenzhouxiangella sp.]